ncbi:ABC transporter ATP-binding protein [Gymnodinialimonas sp. 2305UL16-5]|uniref:ABC transporter ATP-binding protein n=1 Tax=Gymnodinialimonas mytili TaxID=3126503 RepID=UPI0030AF2991
MGIDLRRVSKTFAGQSAVDGITCRIEPGEFFAIVGASGCGKSTLLRLIAGLDPVSDGEILISGEQVSGPELHRPPEGRNVGFVFQSYALWPHMNVRGNVAFPAEMAGMGRSEAAGHADRHLQTVALEAFAERKPADLSGGQRQRVALARCLAQGAQTILMDEPLANLDPHLRNTMEQELVAFHRASGATTIYITHDQREAMAVADRMAVMSAGRFLQVAPPTEIYARPSSAEVARFIGAGSIQPLTWRGSQAYMADMPVPIAGTPGAKQALIRPEDVALVPTDGADLVGHVTSALYRGGHWEADLSVASLPAPVSVSSRLSLEVGATIGLKITGGWALPGPI